MILEAAYAKLNLFLEVTGKRRDGYHELVSVMQTVSLADTLTFRACAGNTARLCGELAGSPAGGENLVIRAANAFFERLGRSFGVDIVLQKRIPAAAGLGGGSADAAATLRGLNRMAGEPFTPDTLREIALLLGADVPFLIEGGTALCHGIGERITPVQARVGGAFVIAIRGEGVSTPAAFAALDRLFADYTAYVPQNEPNELLSAFEAGGLQRAAPYLYNSFEEAILPIRPAARELKAALLAAGAAVAQMSGSGPAVFGWFEEKNAAQRAAKSLLSAGATAFVAAAVQEPVPECIKSLE